MTKQTQKMIKGTLILTVAGVIGKLISALYKIPLNNFVGTVGITYYSSVYPIYSLLTAAALVGIPNTVSKLVAEDLEREEYAKAHQTFRIAFMVTVSSGALISVLMFLFARPIVNVFQWEGSYYALLGLSAAPFFISVAGAIRGYLQGMQNMVPSAISQVIENTFKVIVGIGLVYIATAREMSLSKSVGGATIGISTGLLISASYLLIVYISKRKEIKARINLQPGNASINNREIAKTIGYLALPITIASASYSVMTFIDNFLFPRILNMDRIYNGAPLVVDGAVISEGKYLIGLFGKFLPVVNMPVVISISLIASVVPAIAAANVHKDKTELSKKINEAMQIALKLALPAAVGIFVLASPILNLIYPKDFPNFESGSYLRLYAINLIFMIFAQAMIGIMQGLSKYYIPLFIVIGAAFIKFPLNYVLMNTELGGYGAVFGTLGYYVFISLAGYTVIKKSTKLRQNIFHTFIKPLISAATMGLVVYGGYAIVHSIVHSNTIATLFSVALGVVVYAGVMVVLKGFTKDEIMIMPKSGKILSWMERKNLIFEE